MEWTREKTLLLINEYRQRRGLWDMTCDEYRKKDVKQRLLNEVSDVLGGNIAIPELEKKFHTLRTQYHREISRMKRKEPYNSKWFGFKNLVFLSSPYACRSTKSRLKTDLQLQENTALQKYVLGEVTTGSAESNNMNEEYITTSRKSHTTSSRAQELEKLIEETTKDVDDMDDDEPGVEDDAVDTKPKLGKEISGTYVQINEDENEALESHTHHHIHQQQQQPHHQQSMMELHHSSNTVEAVSFQANESGELHYQSATSSGNASSGNGSSVHVVPTRIIKIQRRDTSNQENGYFEDQSTQHQLHPPPAKRIYFDPNSSHSTTILSASTLTAAQNGNGSNVLTTTSGSGGTLRLPRVNAIVNTTLSPPKPASSPIPPPPVNSLLRDEFSTYGEYVANEMRAITNREVLIALKHKINTAIFEANMAELQK